MPDPTTIHRDPGPQVPDPQRLEAERSPYSPQQFFEPNVVQGLDQIDAYMNQLMEYLVRMGAPPESIRAIEEHRRILNQELVQLRDAIEKTLLSDERLDHRHAAHSPEADIGGRLAELLQRLDPEEKADLMRIVEQHPGITPEEKEIVRRALEGGADALSAEDAIALGKVLESADVSASIGKIIMHHEIGDPALRELIADSLGKIHREIEKLCQTLQEISDSLHGVIREWLDERRIVWGGPENGFLRALTPGAPGEVAGAAVIAAILLGIAAELEESLPKTALEEAARAEEQKRQALAAVERVLAAYPELMNLAEVQSLRQGDYTYGPSPNEISQLMALGRAMRAEAEDHSKVLKGAFG